MIALLTMLGCTPTRGAGVSWGVDGELAGQATFVATATSRVGPDDAKNVLLGISFIFQDGQPPEPLDVEITVGDRIRTRSPRLLDQPWARARGVDLFPCDKCTEEVTFVVRPDFVAPRPVTVSVELAAVDEAEWFDSLEMFALDVETTFGE